MSIGQWDEVEGKVHRLCQEFSHIHRGTVKQILQLCNRDEDHCRRMLQTISSPTSHPNAPGRQFSATPSSTPSEEAVNVPMRLWPESGPLIPQPVPQPTQSSPSQPAATIHLTLDDIMLNMATDQSGSHTMPYWPQPRYPPMAHGRVVTLPRIHFPSPTPHPVDYRPPTLSPMLPDISKILDAQRRQIDEMKQALSDVKKSLSSLEKDAQEKHESLNKIGLRLLQGIQDSTLEEKQMLIQTLQVDIQNLTGKKDELEGTSPLEGHEDFLCKSCFMVGGIQSLSVTSDADVIALEPGMEESAKLLIPSGAIPRGQKLQIRYAYLLDGPFSIPENCAVASPVLYIDYNTSLVKKPLQLHLHHWYAGEDRQMTMTFLKAPHVAAKSGVFAFAKCSGGSFSDDEQFAVLKLSQNLCCVIVAVEKTNCRQDKLLYPANCRLHLLKKNQRDAISFRLYVTYADHTWTEVVKTCIMNDKNWEKVGYAPSQDVILSCPEDGVEAKFDPSVGDGWRITCEGSPIVRLSQVHCPVHKARQQLASKVNWILSWLPCEKRCCTLKVEIDDDVYPPCIHMDLRGAPQVEVDTTLNASTGVPPTDCKSFTVIVPILPSVPSFLSSQSRAPTADKDPSTEMETLAAAQQVAHTRINIDSHPKLEDISKLVVCQVAADWKQVAIFLDVEPSVIRIADTDHRRCEHACTDILERWLSWKPGTGRKKRTWRTVLSAVEEAGHKAYSQRLKTEMFHLQ